MKKFLILGFGRMGITHLAHINGELAGQCHFNIFDPSKLLRFASYFTVRENIRFLRRINNQQYDGVLITSPPRFHSVNFRETLQLSDTFFIEKPLLLSSEEIALAKAKHKLIYCGYVLRKNPCVRFVKNLVQGFEGLKIEVEVLSNLGQNETDDWRFDIAEGGGCINELGSHAVNLALHFTKMREQGNRVQEVHYVDVGTFSFDLNSYSNVNVQGDWNTNVRKTQYRLHLQNERVDITTDLQSVWGEIGGKEVVWSPREDELSVGFYLRGIDFALQSQHWLRHEIVERDLTDSVLTDEVISEVVLND